MTKWGCHDFYPSYQQLAWSAIIRYPIKGRWLGDCGE
jgi:hypothetical protein